MKELKTTRWMIALVIVVCQVIIISLLVLAEVYVKGNIFTIEIDNVQIIEYISCNTYTFDRIGLLFVNLLLSLCMIQSYRARKLPANFNETKYIAVSVLCTKVFLMSYLMAGDMGSLSETLLMGFANISMILIMYGYKLVIIVFYPNLNNATVLRRQLMEL